MNPIMSVVRGATKAVDRSVSNVRTKMMEGALPTPQAAYNLGMGIGPMLQNIVSEMKRKDSGKKEETKTEAKIGGLESKQQLKLMTTQFNTMITVLRDIKNIGMLQLKNEQLKAFESRRQQYLSEEDREEAGSGSLASKGSISATKTSKEKGHGLLEGTDTGLYLKVLLGGLAAYQLWDKVLDDQTKAVIIEKMFTGQNSLTSIVTDMWKKAYEADSTATLVGTLIAAHLTGLLGVLGFAGKVLWQGGKLVAAAGTAGMATAGVAATSAAAVAATSKTTAAVPASVAAVGAAWQGMVKDNKHIQGRESGWAGETQHPGTVPTLHDAAPKAESTTAMGNLAKGLATATRWLTKGLMGVGGIFSGMDAYDNFKEGKNVSGTINATSAALSAAALASLFVPGGQVLTPFLAAGAAATGIAGTVGQNIEKGDKKIQAPAPSATPTARNSNAQENIPAEEVMKIIQAKFNGAGYGPNQTWAALSNAARESQFRAGAHNGMGEDSWGIFQMNRRGGMGAGHSPEHLSDPNYNTELLLANLKAAETRNDYFGKEARAFRDATSKEEAAEHLRRFLFGNGTASQQMAGLAKQQEVNASFESGRYGRVPDLSTNSYAGAPAGLTPGTSPSVISPSTVTSADASGATAVAQITSAVTDFMKVASGGVSMVDGSNKISINNSSTTAGGGMPARVNDSIRGSVTGIVYPAEAGYV